MGLGSALVYSALILNSLTGCQWFKKEKATPKVSINEHQAQAELLREMYFVVYQKPPQDVQEFLAYQNALEQGASLEGIYNGFVHSARYRHLENTHPGAKALALKSFSEELYSLEKELKEPALFNAKSALPLQKPLELGTSFASSSVSDMGKKISSAHVGYRIFLRASIFTLKRVLGDEALKIISEKEKDRESLATWYGRFAIQLSRRDVSFGLELRNKADIEFHHAWALRVSVDRLRWEVLNRVHRLLNELNRE